MFRSWFKILTSLPSKERLALCLVAAAFSCDSPNLDNSLNGSLEFSITPTSGANQSAAPRQVYAQPIEFLVKDMRGEPLANVAIEFRLIDVTGNSDVNSKDLEATWIQNKISTAELHKETNLSEKTDKPTEDLVGRIVAADDRTNEKGIAQVTVKAPAAFSKKVALVARLQSEGEVYKGLNFGLLSTSTIGSAGETLAISTTNELNEKAGDPFALYISIVINGVVVTAYDGSMELSIASEIGSSWPEPTFPSGRVSCEFIAGICKLSGPYTLMRAAATPVAVEDVIGLIGPARATIQVAKNVPVGIALSSTPPDQAMTHVCKSADPTNEDTPCIRISADIDSAVVYAAVVDKGGNYLSDAVGYWSATGVLSYAALGLEASYKKIFTPNATGIGSFTINSGSYSLVNAYEVVPGQPAAYGIAAATSDPQKATNAFAVNVTMIDRKGNLASGFKGSEKLQFGLVGASASPNGSSPTSSFSETLKFIKGKATSTGTLRATRAGETPYITVMGLLGNAHSANLTVSPGPTASVRFKSLPGNDGTFLEGPLTIATMATKTFYVAGYDSMGNFTEDTLSNYEATGVLKDSLAVTLGIAATMVPVSTGTGTLIATPVNTAVPAIETDTITVVLTTTTLTGTPSNPSRDASLNVTIGPGGTGGIYQYKYDLLTAAADCSLAIYSSWIPQATPITESIGADGNKLICVISTDEAGNVSASDVSYAWLNDQTAPDSAVTTSTKLGPNVTAGPDTNFVGTASDLTSGVASVHVALKSINDGKYLNAAKTQFDSGSQIWFAASGTTSWSVAFADSLFVNGQSYALESKAKDAAGNEETSFGNSGPILWDDIPPNAAFVINSNDQYTISTAVSLTITSVTGIQSYSILNATDATCSESGWTDWASFTANPISHTLDSANGVKTVCLKVRDDVLNVASDIDTITLDTVQPVTKLTSTVAAAPVASSMKFGPAYTAGSYTTLNGTVSDATSKANKAEISFRDDTAANCLNATLGTFDVSCPNADSYSWIVAGTGTNVTSWTFTTTTIDSTLFADGRTYTLALRSTDNAGNVEVISTRTLTWDATAPPNVAFKINNNASYTNDKNVLLLVTTTPTDDLAYYRKANGTDCSTAAWTAYSSWGTAISHVLTSGDATKTVCMMLMDAAGNVTGNTATASILYDSTRPISATTIASEYGPDSTAGSSTVFSGTAEDPVVSGVKSGLNRVAVAMRDTSINKFLKSDKTKFDQASMVFIAGATGNSWANWEFSVPDSRFIDGRTYEVYVRAEDAAGNFEDYTTHVITWYSKIHVTYTHYDSAGPTYTLMHGKKDLNTWSTEVIDTQSSLINPRSSLALDSNEFPHVSYARLGGSGNYYLLYGKITAGAWATESVETGGISDTAGLLSAIALDKNNDVKIVHRFIDATTPSDKLRYATGTASPFSLSTITSLAVTGSEQYTDMAVAIDNANDPHLLFFYYDGTNYVMRYSKSNTGVWGGIESLTATGCSQYRGGSIAIDSSGNPHIAYICKKTDNSCKLFHGTKSGSWTHTERTVVAPATCDIAGMNDSYRPSIVLDSLNKVHISYVKVDAGDLMYETNASGSWVTATLQTVGNVGWDSSIARDSMNKIYIIYLDNLPGSANLKMVSKPAGGIWTSVPDDIDSSGKVTGVGDIVIVGDKGRSHR